MQGTALMLGGYALIKVAPGAAKVIAVVGGLSAIAVGGGVMLGGALHIITGVSEALSGEAETEYTRPHPVGGRERASS